MADLIDIARGNTPPAFSLPVAMLADSVRADPAGRRNRAYLRLMVADRPGVLAEITAAMRDAGVSIESLIQQGRQAESEEPVLVALVTHEGPEGSVAKALELLDGSPSLSEAPLVMWLLG